MALSIVLTFSISVNAGEYSEVGGYVDEVFTDGMQQQILQQDMKQERRGYRSKRSRSQSSEMAFSEASSVRKMGKRNRRGRGHRGMNQMTSENMGMNYGQEQQPIVQQPVVEQPAAVTFSVLSQTVLRNCTGCHSSYSNFNTVRSRAQSILSMVEGGHGNLTNQQLDTLRAWINGGMTQ